MSRCRWERTHAKTDRHIIHSAMYRSKEPRRFMPARFLCFEPLAVHRFESRLSLFPFYEASWVKRVLKVQKVHRFLIFRKYRISQNSAALPVFMRRTFTPHSSLDLEVDLHASDLENAIRVTCIRLSSIAPYIFAAKPPPSFLIPNS